MLKTSSLRHYSFWLLILVTLVFVGLGLALISWNYSQGWIQTMWHVCQNGIQNLGQHLPTTWQLVIMATVTVVTIRVSWSVLQQVLRTRRFVRLFLPLRETPPTRLLTLLKAHNLAAADVVYLDLATPHTFCLGFWRPRIWLTAGLVNLLTDEELTAVVAHEAYHCRRRDPLRLLISRALKAAFFFLPLVGALAKSAELQQELAADQSTILYLGDDLPLLCALQKLLKQGTKGAVLPGATFNLFNVTEARLRRLVYPSHSTPFRWGDTLANWSINLGVIMILGSIGYLATEPVVEHGDIGACVIEQVANPLQTQLSLPDRRFIMTIESKTLKVISEQKMHCGGCENTVKFTLKQLPGVREVEASHKTQLIKLSFDPQTTELEQVRQELDWIGYQVVEAEET